MSDSYETTGPSGSGVASPDTPGKVDAAKHEAADLKDTAPAEAKDVLATAKDEASAVVDEAKWQTTELYAQAQQEVMDQANTQQQRLAEGLHTVSDDLGSMAAASPHRDGVAAGIVREVSGRLSAAAAWLGERDTASVLTEVKRFARCKPGTFILVAAVTGIVAGRLTRALAANASDQSGTASASRPALPVANPRPNPVGGVGSAEVEDTPIYAQRTSASARPEGEDGYERPDPL